MVIAGRDAPVEITLVGRGGGAAETSKFYSPWKGEVGAAFVGEYYLLDIPVESYGGNIGETRLPSVVQKSRPVCLPAFLAASQPVPTLPRSDFRFEYTRPRRLSRAAPEMTLHRVCLTIVIARLNTVTLHLSS